MTLSGRKTLQELTFKDNFMFAAVMMDEENTKGRNDSEVSDDLIHFLKFAGAELGTSSSDYNDEFVARLQKSVDKVKNSREMGGRYMTLEELIKEERREARDEGLKEGLELGHKQGLEQVRNIVISVLSSRFPITDNLKARIAAINDSDALLALSSCIAVIDSLTEFEQELDKAGF